MARKRGKKRSDPGVNREDAPGSAIPGTSSTRDVPSSSSRSYSAPTSVGDGSRHQAREGFPAQAQLAKSKQPEQSGVGISREDASGSRIPGRPIMPDVPSSSTEKQPCSTQLHVSDQSTEQASVSTQLAKPKQPGQIGVGQSQEDVYDSEVPCRSRLREVPSSSDPPDEDEPNHPIRESAVIPALARKPKKLGKLGRAIRLISNCYPLKFSGCYIYHYDIEVNRLGTNFTTQDSVSATNSSPNRNDHKKYRCLNTKLNRQVFRQLCKEHFDGSFAVYDGVNNMYCVEKLPIGNETILKVTLEAEDSGDPSDPRGPRMDVFQITIKPVVKKESGRNTISLEPLNALFRGETTSVSLEAVMVLETVLRYVPCLRYVPVGRSFFSPPDFRNPLGNGKEAWFGYHQSVRLGQKTAIVNLNTSTSSFYESIPVIEYIQKLLNKDLSQVYLSKQDIHKVDKDIRNIRVQTTHQFYRRKYCIERLSGKSANESEFIAKENGRDCSTTVKKYFETKYRICLSYPHLPCLKVKNRSILLPMEVCEIVKGQHSNRELNPKQQAEMIKYTAKPPRQRFEEIDKVYKNSDYDKNEYLKKFGLKVLDKPLPVNGRILEAPNVVYRQNSEEFLERPKNGSWNMRFKQFFTGTTIKNWTLLSFANKEECHFGKLKQFASSLHRYANEQGVALGECKHIQIVDAKLENVHFHIKDMKRNFHAELVFIVLPFDKQRSISKTEKMSQVLYSEVKRTAETSIGIVTQCVKAENVVARGTNASFVSNLCLKMNAKMGGVNNSLVPAEVFMHPDEQILVVGADVNHPAPTDSTCYSLAAAVANVDAHPSRYAAIVRPQANNRNYKKMVEVIVNMEEMMRYLLLEYYRGHGKKKPKKIIVYRDGVSDGQFPEVQEKEIKMIRDACTNLESGYSPRITFLVVQKRHHVRFLSEDRTGNPPPGTVVDTTVTHPLNFDFFLYSHCGLKGTSRPGYYTVLEDGNEYSFDAVQKMTYSLCHTYVRCTKSISLPAPVQYADLAAYRARRHLNSHLAELESRGSIEKDMSGKFDIEIGKVRKIIDVLDCMKGTMYYA